MTLKTGKTGRIVVPKPIRGRLGMDPEVDESADGLTLKPVAEKPSMVRENGIWVHQGVVPGGIDWNHHIEEQRKTRHRQVSGL